MIYHGIFTVNVIAEYIPVGNQIRVTRTIFSSAMLKEEKLVGDLEEIIYMQVWRSI
jgi:hypothetical protein